MKYLLSGLLALSVLSLSGTAGASLINASDGLWSITVDTERQPDEWEGFLREGLVDWRDPFFTDHMQEESWWWRGNNDTQENPFSSLVLFGAFKPSHNTIFLEYGTRDGLFSADLLYELNAAGDSSSLFERLYLRNSGDEPLDLSLFAYTNLGLSGDADNDNAFGDVLGITQYDGLNTASVIPYLPIPDHFEISKAPLLVGALEDNAITNLTDTGSPFGPQDASFAFQWNFTLEPGASYMLGQTKTITVTPEPLSCALFLFGGGAFFTASRFRRKKSLRRRKEI